MLNAELIAATLLWPALTAAVVLALAFVPRVAQSRAAALVVPLAVAAGFVVGYWGIVGAPALWPGEARARLPHVAALGFAAACVTVWGGRRTVVAWAAAALASMLSMRLILVAAIELQWTTGEAVVRVAALSAGLLATWLVLDRAFHRAPARPAALGMTAFAGLAAPLMLFSDTLLVSQLHGALGVAAAVAAAAVWLAPHRVRITAAAPVVVCLAWSHWVIALLFANMPATSFALLCVAVPAAAAAGWLLERRRPRWAPAGAVLALSLALVTSVALGGLRYARSADQTSMPATGGDAAAAQDYGYGYDHD